jgi:SAM-dependent methyltransferase
LLDKDCLARLQKFQDRLNDINSACPLQRWPELLRQYAAIQKRHLIYHVYAAKANDVWQRNLRQLARRWGVFNGRRIIAVATDSNSMPAETVERYMTSLVGEDRLEWIVLNNDTELREATTLPALLQAIKTIEPDALFYAHTKGVSPWGTPPKGGITWWRNAMYHYLLDESEKMDELLRRYPCVGTCKIVWRGETEIPPVRFGLVNRGQGPSPYPSGLFHGSWMFSGTYFWARCDALFGNWRWPFVPHDHYGVEAYLSGIFPASQAKSVYQPWPEDTYPQQSAYHPIHHKDRIEDDVWPPRGPDPSNKNLIWALYSAGQWDRVLELGPLDGRDTVHLARHAAEAVAIEGRHENVKATQAACDSARLGNVKVLHADLERFDLASLGRFDCVWASGVFYHLPKPWELIARLATVTGKVFGWSHLAESGESVESGYRGQWHAEQAGALPSGLSPRSFWVVPDDFALMFQKAGFRFQFLAPPGPHPNGLQAQFCAEKS